MSGADLKDLTPKQLHIVEFIGDWQRKNGHPPTQAEISEHFGFGSLNAVRSHLLLIEKKGYLRLNSGKARGIQLVSLPASIRLQHENSIPILGSIAAGVPIWAEQNMEGFLPVPPTLFGCGELFALHVIGDSMTGAGINSGDLAVINKTDSVVNGEIAAVLIEQEATLKRVYLSSKSLVLKSENPDFSDLTYNLSKGDFVRILGRFKGIIRTTDNRCYS
ncbi:MAG: transcriptional repressor LexA [bacterium]|nr:transcriptional repressor LexA [bacterium]